MAVLAPVLGALGSAAGAVGSAAGGLGGLLGLGESAGLAGSLGAMGLDAAAFPAMTGVGAEGIAAPAAQGLMGNILSQAAPMIGTMTLGQGTMDKLSSASTNFGAGNTGAGAQDLFHAALQLPMGQRRQPAPFMGGQPQRVSPMFQGNNSFRTRGSQYR